MIQIAHPATLLIKLTHDMLHNRSNECYTTFSRKTKDEHSPTIHLLLGFTLPSDYGAFIEFSSPGLIDLINSTLVMKINTSI